MRLKYVIDASVGIKLFVVEEFSEIAEKLFEQLATDPPAQFYVPDLFYVECANILWKYVCRFGYPPENAKQDVIDLRNLALISIPTAELIESALELALQYDLTAYDACYAALANLLSLPLVTADETLNGKLARSSLKVNILSEVRL